MNETSDGGGHVKYGQEMETQAVTPILNVSDLPASFDWFARLGWAGSWEWCPPGTQAPTFGGVRSGEQEIHLCLDGQGGRGDHATWISLWVDDVDAAHEHCVREGLEVIAVPEDKPWGLREMHLRHPDGHVFRIGTQVVHHP